MTKEELVKKGEKELADSQRALLLYMLLYDEDKTKYIKTRKKTEENERVVRYLDAIRMVKQGAPVQLAAGRCYFYENSFFVNQSTLIPRFDTETLIDEVLKYRYPTKKKVSILDLCSGTGCIGLTLLKQYKEGRVLLCDVSQDALSLSYENAKELSVQDRTEFRKLDLLSGRIPEGTFDIITMNPPYIKSGELYSLEDEVKCFEPISALDGGEDGLLFYRAFFNRCKSLFSRESIAFLEIGYDLGESVPKLAREQGFEVLNIALDMDDHPRVVVLTYQDSKREGEEK